MCTFLLPLGKGDVAIRSLGKIKKICGQRRVKSEGNRYCITVAKFDRGRNESIFNFYGPHRENKSFTSK